MEVSSGFVFLELPPVYNIQLFDKEPGKNENAIDVFEFAAFTQSDNVFTVITFFDKGFNILERGFMMNGMFPSAINSPNILKLFVIVVCILS